MKTEEQGMLASRIRELTKGLDQVYQRDQFGNHHVIGCPRNSTSPRVMILGSGTTQDEAMRDAIRFLLQYR